MSSTYHNRVSSGRCFICQGPRGRDGTETRCRPCADVAARHQRNLRDRRRANGRCAYCDRPRCEFSVVYCLEHYRYHREYGRKRYGCRDWLESGRGRPQRDVMGEKV